MLAFTTRAAARDVEKVLRSAVANAEANHGPHRRRPLRERAFVDEGPTLKRWRARARGRAAGSASGRATSRVKVAPRAGPLAEAAGAPAGGREADDARSSSGEAEGARRGTTPKPRDEPRRRRTGAQPRSRKRAANAAPQEDRDDRGERVMGQKVHPGGLRVGIIHDWKSNWYTSEQGLRRRAARGRQDPRAHLRQARATRACPTS